MPLTSFGVIIELPNIKSKNTPATIEKCKLEIEPAYVIMDEKFKAEVDLDQFLCVSLVHDAYVDCSPSDFFSYVKDLDIKSIHDSYLNLQNLIDSPESLIEYENATNSQNQRSLIADWQVNQTRYGVFKHRVLSETPPLHGRYNQEIKCNRRINQKNWFFSEYYFGTTLKIIISGSTL